ncbi:uncharacterized protein LOC134807944 isoform X2 [Pan troglodytes]|uniref:uncharacterized protein LOC134807944 isoform X2 n=1 Tax=Pan troglodytes TaxID=9598 RepID=UPI003013D599
MGMLLSLYIQALLASADKYMRAQFSWCQDMKIQGTKNLKEQHMDCQGLASSALSPTLQSYASCGSPVQPATTGPSLYTFLLPLKKSTKEKAKY